MDGARNAGTRRRRFWAGFWQDVRYGARVLRLNPGFTAICVLSLALGIGANTAIFQLIDAVRMRVLPVKNPEELAIVRIKDRSWNSGNFRGLTVGIGAAAVLWLSCGMLLLRPDRQRN